MAASKEYTERHLTPGGWVEGTTREDSGGTKLKDPPVDRVLTVVWKEECNGYGPVVSGQSTLWTSSDSALVEQLLVQYGEAPRSL